MRCVLPALAIPLALTSGACSPRSDNDGTVMTEAAHIHHHVHAPDVSHGHTHDDFPTGAHTHEHAGH